MDNLKNDIIFNTINSGIIILDEELNIKAWNRWMAIYTHLGIQETLNKNLCELFPSIDEKRLKRKIKSVLVTNTSSFYSVDPHRYLIKIELSNITNPVYDSMQQDVTIAPYKREEKLVALFIYDKTVLCESNAKLEKLNNELRELSYKDPMTGAYNRRYFFEESAKLLSLAEREKRDSCVIILDIDKFKDFNDSYGHDVGDEVIIKLAHLLKNQVRNSDVVARFGGEEFVIFLYNTNLYNATHIADVIREEIHKINIDIGSKIINFTASFGVAKFHKEFDQDNIEQTISRADKCLYVAKNQGRNKVISETYLGASIFNKDIDTKAINIESNIYMLND
ncbi:MAG: diguanylate cyclase [Arcobacteraceae bacterium]